MPGALGDMSLAAVASNNGLRLSSFGRNLSGVWRTEGAEEGGLKMTWSCWGDLLLKTKVESGPMLRRFLERL